MISRDVVIGVSFLLAIFFYAVGSGMVDAALEPRSEVLRSDSQATLAIGALLMFGNSVCVICIGSFMYPLLAKFSQTVAASYLATRCAEAILLGFSICIALACKALDEDSFGTSLPKVLLAVKWSCYQFAMMSLSIGSIPVWIVTYQYQLLPKWLSVCGVVGYIVLLVGGIGEILGYPYGIPLSTPGGLFELILPFWLFWHGFKTTTVPGMERLKESEETP